jgi:hypothetical protein
MPLKSGKKNIGYNIKELVADNKKVGKAKGAKGKARPMKQIIVISISAAKPKKYSKKK